MASRLPRVLDVKLDLAQPTDEIRRLQRCINDLVGILALPAVWSGADPKQVIRILLDITTAMLHLDLVFLQLNHPTIGENASELRTQRNYSSADSDHIRSLLERWLMTQSTLMPQGKIEIDNDEMSLVAVRLDLQGTSGWLVAGAWRRDFPQQTESLLLNVAANQAVIGLQEAGRLNEQKHHASELDERIARRTQELAVANEILRREIADRKNVEERLRKSEEALGAIINSIPAMVWSTRPDGSADFFNANYLAYMGLPQEKVMGRGWTQAVHPDDMENLARVWQAIRATGNSGGTEARLRRFDGEYRWFLMRAEPMRDESGTVVKWYGLNTDIEDRKRAEEALRASETNLRERIDSIPGLVCTMNAVGKLEQFNRPLLQFFGKSPAELKGWATIDAVHPDDLPRVLGAFNKAIETGVPYDVEHRCRRFDGVYIWFQVRALPVRDASGAVTGWYVLLTDIEDRKQVEEQLLRSEEFLREGQSLARIGNYSWLIETDEIKWSEHLYQIFEFDPAQGITLKKIEARVHPDDLHLVLEIAQSARRGVRDFEYEHRLLMPNQSVKYLRVLGHAGHDKQGRLEYLGAVQDVTQHHMADADLARARTELANVSRITSLGVLTAAIAHEVNQPLSGIVTNASTCLRMLASDPPNLEGARETARRAIRDGNRASEVITRLRTLFTRKENYESVSLNDATREVLALSMNEIQRGQVVVRLELAEGLPLVRGNRVQIQQVMLNLLRNAVEAMNTLNDRQRELIIRTSREVDQAVRLSVVDVGLGLDREVADRLFQPFFTTKADGMGIGLSISRSIVEAHQGRLWATPNDGFGATFCFSLPCETNTKV